MARDWDAVAELLVDEITNEDRRRVVNQGIRVGREATVASMRATADLGLRNLTATVLATRGRSLTLTRDRFLVEHQGWALAEEVLGIVEIDAHDRITARVAFDLDDIDAAFVELDARYLAGEAAAHARTWSVIARGYAAFNRSEYPATTPDWVNINHRRGATAFAPGDLTPYIGATWDVAPDITIRVEAVHRLSNLGAVVAHAGTATSQDGFDAEWRMILIATVEGEMINRVEFFDESDIAAALAQFDQLHRPAPRLENTPSRINKRTTDYFADRDWDAITKMLAEDISSDDRRRVVSAGVRKGRDASLASLRAVAALGGCNVDSTVISTRGERLALIRDRYAVRDKQADTYVVEVLDIIEIDVDERISARVVFDLDDIDAAFEELDARYLAGEAAVHSNAWSVVTQAYAALNRRKLFATTPDWMNSDHRRAIAFEPGELISWIRASWDISPDITLRIEAVHRLTNTGVVVTHTANATAQEGFNAEWRIVTLITVEGERINRVELYDEEDLDTALARFDELDRPTRQLENAASQVIMRHLSLFATRDWDAMAEGVADEFCSDDRRHLVGAGVRLGRDAEITEAQAMAEVGADNITSIALATRGKRLALSRFHFSIGDQQPQAFHAEALGIVEINADNQIAARVMFDIDDIDAAFAELEARYVAGETAAHARTWSRIAEVYAGFNRRELPTTSPGFANVDHRRVTAFAPGELAAFTRATWETTPDIRIYVEAVHRLANFGAVLSSTTRGTSLEGFDAESREICIMTFDGELINRCELFDESDVDVALARFDELHQPRRKLENGATRAYQRSSTYFTSRDWNALRGIATEDVVADDRRRTVNAGLRNGIDALIEDLQAVADAGFDGMTASIVATRGTRLALSRTRASAAAIEQSETFHGDALNVIEVDGDERMTAVVVFDANDTEAAITELEARYLPGEGAAHAGTWSVIAQGFAAANRRELVATAPDIVNIDHRQLGMIESGKLMSFLREAFDGHTNIENYAEAVHRLTDVGAVLTHVAAGTTRDGFDAEWRMIIVEVVNDGLISRVEYFDEADLDAAITKFEELDRPVPQLENAASQVDDRFRSCFAARDWGGIAETLAEDVCTDDRRSVVGIGPRRGRDAAIAHAGAMADIGAKNILSTVIATRGQHLILRRARFSGRDQSPEAFHTETLSIIEINADEQITAAVQFDPENLDAAIEELDARYLAGEAAAHAHTWSVIARTYAGLNRNEGPPTIPNWVNVDHRAVCPVPAGEMTAYIGATLDDTPELNVYIESVHRLTDLGVVVTHVAKGTSQDGFDAEWRFVSLLTVEGDSIGRGELFDESDLVVAIASFDELSRSAQDT